MLISKALPSTGVCFAWNFKNVPEGTVWLEFVRFEKTDDGYRYTRIPLKQKWCWDGE